MSTSEVVFVSSELEKKYYKLMEKFIKEKEINEELRKELFARNSEIDALKCSKIDEYVKSDEELIDEVMEMGRLEERVEELEKELEIWRTRVSICGVLSLSNTPESLKSNSNIADVYKCQAIDCVIRAVEREINLINKNKKLMEEINRWHEIME